MPHTQKVNKEAFERYSGDKGVDAVLTTRVIALDTEETVLPTSTATRASYYSYFYTYYSTAYDVIQYPEERGEEYVLRVESNLFETTQGKLVWIAASQTLEFESIGEVILTLSKTLTEALQNQGFIAR